MSDPAQRAPSTIDAVRAVIEKYVRDIHTTLPGRVESYDAAKQRADVKPLVKRRIQFDDGTESVEELPVIPGVPVAFPRAGDWFLSLPIAKGDLVTLHFTSLSIDKWLTGNGADTDPYDFRTHDMSDAIAVPGLYPFKLALSEADASKLVLGKDSGLQMRISDSLIELGNSSATLDFLAHAQKVLTELQAIVTGFNSHSHTTTATIGPSAVVGVISPPIASLSAPSSVACSTVKAE